MKSNLTFTILFLGMLSTTFGQEKVTEMKYQKYDANLGEWKIQELEQTEYDDAERPILWSSFHRHSEDSLIHSGKIENSYWADTVKIRELIPIFSLQKRRL